MKRAAHKRSHLPGGQEAGWKRPAGFCLPVLPRPLLSFAVTGVQAEDERAAQGSRNRPVTSPQAGALPCGAPAIFGQPSGQWFGWSRALGAGLSCSGAAPPEL